MFIGGRSPDLSAPSGAEYESTRWTHCAPLERWAFWADSDKHRAPAEQYSAADVHLLLS